MPLHTGTTSADPIVPDPTNPQSLNRYSYVLNNPLKYTDPSGHWGLSSITKSISRLFKSVERKIRHSVKDTIRQATTFSLQSITNVAIDAGLEYYGIDSDGTLGKAIKRIGNEAVKYATDGAIEGLYKEESSGRSGSSQHSRRSIGTERTFTAFTGKNYNIVNRRLEANRSTPKELNPAEQEDHNLIYLLSMVLDQTGMVFAIAEHGNFFGAKEGFKVAGRRIFFISAPISAINGFYAFINGDDNLVMKSALSINMSYIMVEFPGWGTVIGAIYFGADGLGYIDPIINYVDPSQQYQRSNLGQ